MKSLNGVAAAAARVALAVGTVASSALANTTWTVCQDGSCDFMTIQQAIDASASGDIIELSAETYIEPTLVVHDLSISIAGSLTGTTELSGHLANRIIAISGTSTVQLRNLVFKDGRTFTENGGAIRFSGQQLDITDCRFDNNQGGEGGAIFAEGGSLRVARSDFTNNRAQGQFKDGGAIRIAGASATLAGCLFLNNYASYSGGGVAQIAGSLTVTDSVFASNSSPWGGALEVYAHGFALTVVNCTLIDNTGAGASSIKAYYATVRLVNTIIRGTGSLLHTSYGGGFTGAHSIVSHGDLPGWGNQIGDPMLSSTFEPLPGSPCIDAGTARAQLSEFDASGSGSPCHAYATDYLGNPRYQDAGELSGLEGGCLDVAGRIDVGAVESPGRLQLTPRIGDLTADREVSGFDLGQLLGTWGTSNCIGDVNADGHVDGLDLSELLGDWTICK